jgi:hypothetical protein
MTQPTEARPAAAKDTRSATEEVRRPVQGEFPEIPGRVIGARACRLPGLDGATCSAVLAVLIDSRLPFRMRDRAVMRIARATAPKPNPPPRANGQHGRSTSFDTWQVFSQ